MKTIGKGDEIPNIIQHISGVHRNLHVSSLSLRRSLPFGASKDPVRLLSLHVTWPDQHESLVTEDDLRSDLDPDEAPLWSVSVSFEEQGGYSVLLEMYYHLCQTVSHRL